MDSVFKCKEGRSPVLTANLSTWCYKSLNCVRGGVRRVMKFETTKGSVSVQTDQSNWRKVFFFSYGLIADTWTAQTTYQPAPRASASLFLASGQRAAGWCKDPGAFQLSQWVGRLLCPRWRRRPSEPGPARPADETPRAILRARTRERSQRGVGRARLQAPLPTPPDTTRP